MLVMIITFKILIYFAFVSHVAVCGKRTRSVEQKRNVGAKQWKLHDNHKHWRTSNNQKRANINLMARQLQPKPNYEETEYHRSGTADKSKYRVFNYNIRNKLREGYKRVRPEGVRNSPHIKYIARNQLPESTSNAMKDSQVQGGEIYGNLDNLGITYDKTNQRVLFSVNRKNNPLIVSKKTKRRKTYGTRKNNLQDTRPNLENTKDFDEPLPTEPKNTLNNELQSSSSKEVSRNVVPFEDTPKSADTYPNTLESLVYGNLNNIGIPYGKTNQRILYSQSRRNAIVETLLKLLTQPSLSRDQRHRQPLVVLLYKNPHRELNTHPLYVNINQRASSGDEDDFPMMSSTRRNNNDSNSEESDGLASSDFEFNIQNPFTVHKNRYLQNYLWHHKLTGDHVNVNPYAPRFITEGATAPELFYSRKWWYFNQDDFIPFG